MANFRTHFLTAATLSGVTAVACTKAGVVDVTETPILLGCGTLGGLLPDVDSKHSLPLKMSFIVLAGILAFLTLFAFAKHLAVLELIAVWLSVFCGVRYVALWGFKKMTVHRGAFHSVLAAVFFGLGTVSLSYHLFQRPYQSVWLYGTFMTLGYMVHLTLDEMCSVDLLGRRFKRSFGTALKPISLKYWKASFLLCVAIALLYESVPPPWKFSHHAWGHLESHYARLTPWLVTSSKLGQ